MKFATKAQSALDYPALPPEATFRISDFAKDGDWRWTVAIAVPDAIDAAALRRAVTAIRERYPEMTPLDRVKLAVLPAGTQARILHVGASDAEQPTIDRLVAFVREATGPATVTSRSISATPLGCRRSACGR